jgi:hypothetical protein
MGIVDELKASMRASSEIPASNGDTGRPPPRTRRRGRRAERQNGVTTSNRSASSQSSRRSVSTRSRETDADQESYSSVRENATDSRGPDLPRRDADIRPVSEIRAIDNQTIEGIAVSEVEPSPLRLAPDMKDKIGRIGGTDVMEELRDIVNKNRENICHNDEERPAHLNGAPEGIMALWRLKRALELHHGAELKFRVLRRLTLAEFSREYDRTVYAVGRKRKRVTLVDLGFICGKIFPELAESNKEAAKKKIQNWLRIGRRWSMMIDRFGPGILLLLPSDLSDEK